MKITILRHSCKLCNLVQLSDAMRNNQQPILIKCPLYFKRWNAHWFTFMGIRIIIGDFK